MRRMIGLMAALLILINIPAIAAESLAGDMARKAAALTGAGGSKSAILAVVEDGKVTFVGGFGWADEAMGVEAADNTAFRIGSISKTFVAVAALKLAEQGLIDMDQDVATYLEPDFPPFERPVTMRMLLTHSAGFEDMVTGIAVPKVSDTMALKDSVRRYRPAQSIAPGVISYSNYGIALAGYVAERVSGKNFAAFCRSEIFLPLGMAHTTFEHMHDVALVAKPYLPDGRETLEPYINLYPEGSAVSTAEDMAAYMLWLNDLSDARVLTASSKRALFERHYAMADGLTGMGYSWNRKTQGGTTYFEKKGETLHFYSRIAVFPERRAGVFLSVNTSIPEERLDGVMEAAADALCGRSDGGEGRATFDIAGVYKNNCSSDSTMEKIIRYIVPGKMITVEGAMARGYTMNGGAMSLVGPDEYASPLGVIRFFNRDGMTLIDTQSATTFQRVSSLEGRGVQAAVPTVSLLFMMLMLAFALSAPLRGRTKPDGWLIGSVALEFALLLALSALMFYGVISYKLLTYELPVRIYGWIVVAAIIFGAWRARETRGALRIVSILWIVSGAALIAQMGWFHILF